MAEWARQSSMPAVSILLSARDLSYSFGARTLFEGVNFTLSDRKSVV